jgi:hypothetical protein
MRAFRRFYVESQTSDEKNDWYGTERHTEQAVAIRDGKYYSISGSSVTKFNVGGGHRSNIGEGEISKDEYLLCVSKADPNRADTPKLIEEHKS